MILSRTAPFCDDAFTADVNENPPELPMVLIMARGFASYDDPVGKWMIPFTNKFIHPTEVPYREWSNTIVDVTEIKSFACVIETREKTGSYSGGYTGYKLIWTVRILTFPQGDVIGAVEIIGDEPGAVVTASNRQKAIYGTSPWSKLITWVQNYK